MPDYFTPTVIRPAIPMVDMTPLERLLLSHIFIAEPERDGVYFYADERPATTIWLDRGHCWRPSYNPRPRPATPRPLLSPSTSRASRKMMSRSRSKSATDAGRRSSRTSSAARRGCAL
jgi:hypothetical protein